MIDHEALRVELGQERKELLRRAQPSIWIAKGDEADLATILENKELVLSLAQDARLRLQQIDDTLQRMKRGIYGACVRCGKLIPDERLTALPLTLYCVECQMKLEKRVRR